MPTYIYGWKLNKNQAAIEKLLTQTDIEMLEKLQVIEYDGEVYLSIYKGSDCKVSEGVDIDWCFEFVKKMNNTNNVIPPDRYEVEF